MITDTELKELKDKGLVPTYFTPEAYQTMTKGYMLEGESVRDVYLRVVNAMKTYAGISDDEAEDIFEVTFEKGWAGFASPILSNSGTSDGLPISCFIESLDDTMEDIMGRGIGELAMLSKVGGGVGVSFQNIRPSGSPIKGGLSGKSDGVIPFAKVYDSAILASKQPKVRRGNVALYLDIEHKDALDFIDIRRVEGDVNRQCLNIHHGVSISDSFMKKVHNGDEEARKLWFRLMKARIETGEPYVLFTDNVGRRLPEGYILNNVTNKINYSNICVEILQYADTLHTVICCLSSVNLTDYFQWKDWRSPRTGRTLIQIMTRGLDHVMEEFIQRGSKIPFMENAVRSAIKGRGIGLGVMGWHTLLQENMIPFESFLAMSLNNEIFSKIKKEADEASLELGREKGVPEWCEGTGMRNVVRTAVAPTKTNSLFCKDVSAGIEPITANTFQDNTAKGTFVRKNKTLEKVLDSLGLNNETTWKSIQSKQGSVQHLDFPEDVKKAFLTAYEINQKAIIQQVAQRTPYICQSQSVNLFFPNNVEPKTFSDVHKLAWELGVKTLYYCKSTKDRIETTSTDECLSCQG